MKRLTRRLRRAVAQWWECRTRRCSYYTHYQVYGPCVLSHDGWHNAERLGLEHMKNCRRDTVCPVCTSWEERLRA